MASHGNSGLLTDLRQAESILIHRSVRAVASGVETPEAPLRATSSKSQPPHLVFDSHNYGYCQNLSSDHLLSGVSADYPKRRVRANDLRAGSQKINNVTMEAGRPRPAFDCIISQSPRADTPPRTEAIHLTGSPASQSRPALADARLP